MTEATMHFQRGCLAAGLDPGPLDGLRGPRTEAAVRRWLDGASAVAAKPPVIAASWRDFDARDKISGLHPALLALLKAAAQESPIGFDVIEGLRTKERQAQLVAQGASKTLNSRHLTGHAADLWPIDPATGNRAVNDDALLWSLLRQIAAVVKRIAKERGIQIEWGGDWGWDAPHFQLNRAGYPA